MEGKEVEMGTTEHLTNPLVEIDKDPRKQEPFRGKDLVGTSKLVCQNILLPQNIPGCQGDRMMLGPKHYLGGYVTQNIRHCGTVIPELSDNCGVVAHQDNTLTRQLGQKRS